MWNLRGTMTGRLSSQTPNVSNIPQPGPPPPEIRRVRRAVERLAQACGTDAPDDVIELMRRARRAFHAVRSFVGGGR